MLIRRIVAKQSALFKLRFFYEFMKFKKGGSKETANFLILIVSGYIISTSYICFIFLLYEDVSRAFIEKKDDFTLLIALTLNLSEPKMVTLSF
jgi:hypothetical protein